MLDANTILHKKYHRLGVTAREVRSKLFFFSSVQERVLADIIMVTGGDQAQILGLQSETVLVNRGFEINGFRYPMTLDLANLIARTGNGPLFRAGDTLNPMTLNEAQGVLSKAYNGFPAPWEPLRAVHPYLMAEGQEAPRMMVVPDSHPAVRRAMENLNINFPSILAPSIPTPTPKVIQVPRSPAPAVVLPKVEPPKVEPPVSIAQMDDEIQEHVDPLTPQEREESGVDDGEEAAETPTPEPDPLEGAFDDLLDVLNEDTPLSDAVERWKNLDDEKRLRALLLIFGLSEPKVAKWTRKDGNPFKEAKGEAFERFLSQVDDTIGAKPASRKAVRVACGRVQGVGADEMSVGVLRGYASGFTQEVI